MFTTQALFFDKHRVTRSLPREASGTMANGVAPTAESTCQLRKPELTHPYR